jgi:predicted PhzF superfamily epimerase YddE/YHI9
MKIRQYQVDAFATRVFEGNAAAVCSLETWLDDREPLAAGAVALIEAEIAL